MGGSEGGDGRSGEAREGRNDGVGNKNWMRIL